MLPSIDFTQQLSQLQAQLQSMKTAEPVVTDSTKCQYRLPCGLCSKTDTFCGMQSEVKTDE